MKRTIILSSVVAVAAATIMSFTYNSKVAETVNADIVWTGKKVGGQHTGTIDFKSSKLIFDGEKLKGGSFVVDMTTMKCTDLEGEYNQKLIGHLKSDDFFSVDKNETSSFDMKTIKSLDKGQYEVTGDLTIKGITKPLTFTTSVEIEKGIATAKATLQIDRSKYDVKYGSKSFFEGLGDNLIYDDFDLDITIKSKI